MTDVGKNWNLKLPAAHSRQQGIYCVVYRIDHTLERNRCLSTFYHKVLLQFISRSRTMVLVTSYSYFSDQCISSPQSELISTSYQPGGPRCMTFQTNDTILCVCSPAFQPHNANLLCVIFLPTTSFPVILSIENHCSVPQQKKMAQYLIDILGDKLDVSNIKAEESGWLPSPENLKGKILVKVSCVCWWTGTHFNLKVEVVASN